MGSRIGGFFRQGGAVPVILAVTLIVFVIQRLVMASTGQDLLTEWFALRAWTPDAEAWRAFVETEGAPPPASEALRFNWFFPVQLITMMLLHSDGGHIFWNMLLLFYFGRDLEATQGRAGFYRLYIAAGVFGGLLQWGSQLAQMSAIPALGASGAVYGVMALYALRYPRRSIYMFPIFIPIPVIAFMGFKVLMDILGMVEGQSGVAFLAHIGGALVGVLWFRRGDVVAKVEMARRRAKAEKQHAAEEGGRREMDRILGKIQADGLSSLSTKEREFLNRRSRELREDRR